MNPFVPDNVFLHTPHIDLDSLGSRTFQEWSAKSQPKFDNYRRIQQYIENIPMVSYIDLFQEYQTTLLMALFFSKKNIDLMQSRIQREVKQKTSLSTKQGYDIGPQSERDLVQIMFDIFQANSNQLNEDSLSFDDLLDQYQKQVSALNQLALAKCVNIILQNIKDYLTFQEQRIKMRVSDLQRPLSTSLAGTYEYRDPFLN